MVKTVFKGFLFSLVILLVFLLSYLTTAVLRSRDYTRDVVLSALRRRTYDLRIEDMTQKQIDILLAVEDPAFFRHKGVDFRTPGAGITTITQALVKKLYFKRFRPGIRNKILQTLFARFALHPNVSKEDQLRLFINIVYLGRSEKGSVYGFEEAARAYFKKPFQELTEEEYIALVAMIIAPGTFHVQNHPEWNAERVRRIQALLSGKYKPRGLMDLYYGKLPKEVIQKGLPPFSYFSKYYKDRNDE
jgi:membrane peptidoglycan carboxypeptidase